MKAITREEKIMSGENLTPITREEMFLAKAAGQDVETPTPITRREMFLSKIGGSGGGGSDEPVALAAGLYETGAIAIYEEQGSEAVEGMLITPWGEMVQSGAMVVDNGAVSVGVVLPDDLPEKNEYGFYYGAMYSFGAMGFKFYEDGSMDGYQDGALTGNMPAGSVVYSLGVIDASAAYLGVFSISPDGTTLTLSDGGTSMSFALGEAFQPAGDLMLPADGSVTTFPTGAFTMSTALTGISIPKSVYSIESGAFISANLTTVTLAENSELTTIGEFAFQQCGNLKNINLENSIALNSIGRYAFSDCVGLESIVVPNSVETIGDSAFYGCTNLTTINFTGTMEQWNSITKDSEWNYNVPATYVQCSDGQASLK